MALVDQWGRPIDRAALDEPQTARLASLHGEFAGHPIKGLTPAKLASALEAAEQGDLTAQCDLFEDMEDRDGHILTEIGKRKRALLTLEWDIVPPADASAAEKRDAAYAKELVQALPDLEDLMFDLGDAIGKAFACIEIEWARLGREWLPRRLEHRPQRWFQLDQATRSEIRLRDPAGGPDGAALQPFGWLLHTHRAKSGYIGRAALYRTLAWPFLFKWWSARDIAEFLEIYGLPLRLGTYPAGATDKEKSTLLQAVVSIGHNAAGIIPEGMLMEFKEAAKGTHEPFAFWMDFCERTQSKAILGQTLSAEAKSTGMGSGVANLQSEVRDDIRDSDARQLEGTLTRDLIWPLLALNGRAIDPRRAPRFRFDTGEPEDLALYADAIPKLVAVGMPVTVAWAQEKLRIPAAKEGEAVLAARAPEPAVPAAHDTDAPEPTAKAAQAAAKASLPASLGQDAQDTADLQAERMHVEAGPALDGMLDAMRAVFDAADSLEQARDMLISAFPRMDAQQFAAALGPGLVAAALAGRVDVVEESGGGLG